MTDRLDPNPGVAGLEQVGAEDFAKLVAEASENQLAAIVDGPSRKQVLDDIFGRMAHALQPDQAVGLDAVVHFKILDRPLSVAATTTRGGGHATACCRVSEGPGRANPVGDHQRSSRSTSSSS